MIPYDDLVVALANWRSKQGLSVSPVSPASPVASPASPGASGAIPQQSAAQKSGSGPKTPPPGSGPNRPAPAPAPVVASAPALQVSEAAIEVEEHETLLAEDELDSTFDTLHSADAETADEESTAIGSMPGPQGGSRDSFGGETALDPKGSIRPPGTNRNDDW